MLNRTVSDSRTRSSTPVRRVRLTVTYARDGLEVEIADDGAGDAGGADGGHGLIGMRERVALYGASLRTGVRPRGRLRRRSSAPLPRPGAVSVRV